MPIQRFWWRLVNKGAMEELIYNVIEDN